MKKTFLCLAVALLLFGCTGSMDTLSGIPAPYSVEMSGQAIELVAGIPTTKVASLLSRKIIMTSVDVTKKDIAILAITFEDRIQIGDRITTVQWMMKVRLQEGKRFQIIR